MDAKDLAEKIEREYEAAMRADKKISVLYGKVSAGTATYQEAGQFASMSGDHIGGILVRNLDEVYPNGITVAEAMDLIPPPLRKNEEYVRNVTIRIQRTMNERAGVGLKALPGEMNSEMVSNLAEDVASGVSREQILKECENISRKIVDDAAQKNAAMQSRVGMKVRVTREYDDVGVHNGKDRCQWCLDRCGTDMSYDEAYAKGAFERHPGCGCIITYTSKKGTVTRQSAAGEYWHEV